MQLNQFLLIAILIGASVVLFWTFRWWQEHQYNFSGKTVLITGGSRGLGLVIARQLVKEGARIAICARDPAELEQAGLI